MNILSLDLGTNTGWAHNANGVITFGVQNFAPRRFEGGGMRYLRFNRWLTEMRSFDRIDAVFFEEVRRHMGTDAAHIYGGLLGQLTAWCEEREIPYQGIPVQTIKKFATGKGNAGKCLMIEAARGWGHQVTDDNEADAVCLLKYAISSFQPH